MTLPILRAINKRHGPVGLVHVDAHADINEAMFGEAIAHGTPFRRAVEEGLLDAVPRGPDRPARHRLRGRGLRLGAVNRVSGSCRPKTAGTSR